MARPPIRLEQLHIANPCPVSWATMEGDERVRFCSHCRLNVYNLSAMTRGEAETLINEREGRVCVRYYQRPDGTVMTHDCPSAIRRAGRGAERLAGVLAAGVGVVLSASVLASPAHAAAPQQNRPAWISRIIEFLRANRPKPAQVVGDVAAPPQMGAPAVVLPVPPANPPAIVMGKIAPAFPTVPPVPIAPEAEIR